MEIKIVPKDTTVTKDSFRAQFVTNGCQVCKVDSENSHVEKTIGQKTFYLFDSKLAEAHIKSIHNSSPAVVEAINSQSDLIARKYEGGLKVWECGVDLVNYCITENIIFDNRSVLELGCGAGLPGIYARSHGAQIVYLQDYNEDVLKHYTYPCVKLNEADDFTTNNYKLISGDWSSLPELLHDIKFDVLLTAETIYNTDSYPDLHEVFEKLLSPSGVIYIAAKTTYFGVGGSTNEFVEYVKKRGNFTVIKQHDIAGGVPRVIMELRREVDQT